jgi:hypothetical protein
MSEVNLLAQLAAAERQVEELREAVRRDRLERLAAMLKEMGLSIVAVDGCEGSEVAIHAAGGQLWAGYSFPEDFK